ncbi:hypothetical protein BLOT_010388 [Blomia tropicalis]|nr:hypothetical protein BLOT_010388 [Blomia tropicalis]
MDNVYVDDQTMADIHIIQAGSLIILSRLMEKRDPMKNKTRYPWKHREREENSRLCNHNFK